MDHFLPCAIREKKGCDPDLGMASGSLVISELAESSV